MKFKETFDNYDLQEACMHGKHDVEGVRLDYVDSRTPLELLQTLGLNLSLLLKYESGWAVGKTQDEVLDALITINKTIKSYWQELLEAEILPPVIIIDGNLCDGAHRCILAYLFGETVKACVFVTF